MCSELDPSTAARIRPPRNVRPKAPGAPAAPTHSPPAGSHILVTMALAQKAAGARLAVRQAMRIMGHQFVMGRTIGEALERSRKGENAAYRYSFDMLGEGAFTASDAARYLEAYRQAILAIGAGGRMEH